MMPVAIRRFSVVVCILGFVVLAILPFLSGWFQVPFGYLTRDPAQIASLGGFAGLLSNIGVLVWAGCFFVPFFSAALMYDRFDFSEAEGYLFSISILSMVLCADDFFMIHERMPFSEKILFLFYIFFLTFIMVFYKRLFFKTNYVFAMCAVGLFAASLFIDIGQEYFEAFIGDYRIFFEDGFKFLGICFWFGYIWETSLNFCRSRGGV